MRYIVLDTETTGLRWDEGHRVFEIGMIEIKDSQPTGKYFHHLINPERLLSQESMDICQIKDQSILDDKEKFGDIADEMLSFLNQDSEEQGNQTVLVAHNAKFDIGFLNNELSICNKKDLSAFPVVDTVKMAKRAYPNQSVTLDALCKKFELDLSIRAEKGHSAHLDSELLGSVFLRLIEGRTHDEIINFDRIIEDFVGFSKRPSNLEPRLVKPCDKEMQQHTNLINELQIRGNW